METYLAKNQKKPGKPKVVAKNDVGKILDKVLERQGKLVQRNADRAHIRETEEIRASLAQHADQRSRLEHARSLAQHADLLRVDALHTGALARERVRHLVRPTQVTITRR